MYCVKIQSVSIMICGGTGTAKLWFDRAAKIQRPALDMNNFAQLGGCAPLTRACNSTAEM